MTTESESTNAADEEMSRRLWETVSSALNSCADMPRYMVVSGLIAFIAQIAIGERYCAVPDARDKLGEELSERLGVSLCDFLNSLDSKRN